MENPFFLTGKTILVTGASSGLGRAIAIRLSQLGARLVICARREQELKQTLAMLEGGGHHLAVFDLSVGEQIVPWLKSVTQDTGPLSGLVHSAGVQTTLPLRAMTEKSYNAIMKINLDASYWLAKGFRQRGVVSSSGSIVFLGSVLSLVGQPGVSAYAASKGALVPLVKSLALELAKESIRINLLAPGHVKTEMAEALENSIPEEQFRRIEALHPLGVGNPDDVAYAAAYLLSDASKWVTGTTLVVDGGYTAA